VKLKVPINFREEISKLPIVVRYETLKQVRRRRLTGLLFLGSAITAVAMVIGAVLLPTVPMIGTMNALGFSQYAVGMGEVSLFGLIAAVAFSGDSVSSEFEQKTGYLIFPNPIKRFTLLIGKYVSCCIAAALVISMPYLIISVGVAIMYGELPVQLIVSYLFSLLYVCSVVALTLAFSSLFKGAMGASVLPFILLFFGFPIIMAMMMFGGIEPFMFLNYGSDIITDILMNPYPAHQVTYPVGAAGIYLNITTFAPTVEEGIIIILFYLVVSLIVSALLIRRRQMA
jgi:ABC-2 type transport system permease protein